jgi:Amt family ammonium transporter
LLAGASGAASCAVHSARRFGSPDVTLMCNGMLAGLVSITAGCAFVSSWAAVMIGVIAGILVIEAALFVEHRLQIDDPVGAISVHGVCGAFGSLAVGVFANGTYGEGLNGVPGPVRGFLYGDPGQLLAALVGVATNLIWVGSTGYFCYKLVDAVIGHRVYFEDELRGLDVSELGMDGYYDQDGHAPVPRAKGGGPVDPSFSQGTTTWQSPYYR